MTRLGTKRQVAALIAVFVAGLGCSSPTGPTADLTGDWAYSYSSVAPESACPSAPAGFRAGCAGGGAMMLTQNDTQLTGTASVRGSCQSCSTVADFFDARRTATGRWRGGDIELTFSDDVGQCRFTAAVPEGSPARVNGTVTCTFGGITSTGMWSMAR